MVKKFIEEEFPLVEISEFGAKEKNNNYGNISTIHQWWARRPTIVARALILACLFDYPDGKSERKKIHKFIINSCSNFKKLPNQKIYQEELNNLILNENKNNRLRLLDPFAGGGAIPLESLRIGLETYCSDLNPIAVLIEKATCFYFQKFNSNFLNELKKWYKIINNKFLEEIKPFYKNPLNDNDIYAFYWARQIECPRQTCKALIPLISNCLLSSKAYSSNGKKIKRRIALKPIISRENDCNKINFIIQKDDEIDFDPSRLEIFSKGKVTCPACEITLKNEEVMEKVRLKKNGDRLLVIIEKDDQNQKVYRISTIADENIYIKAKIELEKYKDFIPNEKLPEKVIKWRIQNYGILYWNQFFNKRQLLINLIYSKILNEYSEKIKEENDTDVSKGIMLYLSFYLSRLLNYNSKFTYWDKREAIAVTWTRSGIFMRGSYPENNPFTNSSCKMNNYLKYLFYTAENVGSVKDFANIKQSDAKNLDFNENFFDLIITDPPYYDAMVYANPSDFFYIWLKMCLKTIFPELFLLELTPKKEEMIQNRFMHNGDNLKAIDEYKISLINALKEFYRILKPNGIGVIMYTHKSVVAWEVLINALLKSNFTISAAWPIATELKGRIGTFNRVALASSIAIIFKKIKKKKKIFFETQFKNILENELEIKLKKSLLDLQLYGADFFISTIGFALSIFTRYEQVLSQKTGKSIGVTDFLDLVRKIVNNFLLNTILEKNVTQSIDDESNLYIIWCWFFINNEIPLDDALKLAQSFGIELDDLRKMKLISLTNKNFKLLLASDQTRSKYLLKNTDKIRILIDYLHLLAILWKTNSENLETFVDQAERLYGENIWKVGQALAEFFPKQNKEHNILQGLLARFGKSKSKSDIKKWALNLK